MDKDLTQKIKDRLEELPEDIQKAVQSADMDKKIQEIGAKNALHLDQIGNLGDEVYMVMLGFTDPGEFAENIAKELNVPKEKAEAIAKDIGTALFIPIRESMQQFMEERTLHEAILEEGKAPTAQTLPTAPIAITKPLIPPVPVTKPTQPHPADLMLTQKTVTTAPTTPKPATPPASVQATKPATPPVTPQPYKADPYREPAE